MNRQADGAFAGTVYDLCGSEGILRETNELTKTEAGRAFLADAVPGTVAVVWPGNERPLRLSSIVWGGLGDRTSGIRVLLLDCDEKLGYSYIDYDGGPGIQRPKTASDLASLLSILEGKKVDPRETPAANLTDDYELLEPIGEGGMGVVYRARHKQLGLTLALKMLPSKHTRDLLSTARFRREIRAMALCNHPNIVKIVSEGAMRDGRPFLAMEYVPGCTLEDVFQKLHEPGDADRRRLRKGKRGNPPTGNDAGLPRDGGRLHQGRRNRSTARPRSRGS